MSAFLNRIASENLSRVDCPFCHGRLYIEHTEDCPVPAAAKRQLDELADEIVRLLAEQPEVGER